MSVAIPQRDEQRGFNMMLNYDQSKIYYSINNYDCVRGNIEEKQHSFNMKYLDDLIELNDIICLIIEIVEEILNDVQKHEKDPAKLETIKYIWLGIRRLTGVIK